MADAASCQARRSGCAPKCAGKSAVHSTPVGQRRRLIDGGPDQRVPKLHARQVYLDQPDGDSSFEGIGGDGRVDQPGRGEQRLGQRITVVGRCHQQEQPGLRRAGRNPGGEGALQALGQRQMLERTGSIGSRRRTSPAGSSTRASGLPAAAARIRRRARGVSDGVDPVEQGGAGIRIQRGEVDLRRGAGSSVSVVGSPARTAMSRTTGSAVIRLAMKTSASTVGVSSHWASSTMTSCGR